MIGRIFTVGGFTLLSRLTGFARDVVMAAVLGAGPMADAFFVALRLPNHFRAIFAEGAFAAAFVPAYARTLEQDGLEAPRPFPLPRAPDPRPAQRQQALRRRGGRADPAQSMHGRGAFHGGVVSDRRPRRGVGRARGGRGGGAARRRPRG